MKSLFVWTSIFLVAYAAPASAAPSKETTSVLGYSVYAGGIHAMSAQLTIKASPKEYDVALDARTEGILKKIADWSGKFASKGNISAGSVYPTTHDSTSVWKGKPEIKSFKYNGKGDFVSYNVVEGGVDKTPKDLDISLTEGAMDNLSATFKTMMQLPTTSACNGNELVFDGDRNYRMIYKGKTKETLKKSDYNSFAGETIVCTVEVSPQKGKWRKKPRGWLSIQEQGRQQGALPTIWFGKVKGQPDLYVPVKIRIKTDYGTLFMHLTSQKSL